MTKIIESYSEIMEKYDPSKYVSTNVMTKYEKTKIIGLRLEQLSRGAPTLVDTSKVSSLRDIVMKELAERKIPFMLVRTLPNNKKEYYRICDMIIP
jgi:DNA-directed RNA polymerases I, II, and III subunit RPABC2